jgi:hypothetical protein
MGEVAAGCTVVDVDDHEIAGRSLRVVESWSLAARLLEGSLPRRWAHSRGVFRQADVVSVGLAPMDREVLAAAALLHDVGYAPEVVRTGFHPLDGALYLKALGVDSQVVSLVAHHSCADVEAELRCLGDELRAFPEGAVDLGERLIFCDMTTSPDGHVVGVQQRLAEIVERYGEASIVGRFVEAAGPQLRVVTARVAAEMGGDPVLAPAMPPGFGEL